MGVSCLVGLELVGSAKGVATWKSSLMDELKSALEKYEESVRLGWNRKNDGSFFRPLFQFSYFETFKNNS